MAGIRVITNSCKSNNSCGSEGSEKAYGAAINRGYLKDEEITTNIQLDEEYDKENKYFEIDDFKITQDLKCAICPNNIQTTNCKLIYS